MKISQLAPAELMNSPCAAPAEPALPQLHPQVYNLAEDSVVLLLD